MNSFPRNVEKSDTLCTIHHTESGRLCNDFSGDHAKYTKPYFGLVPALRALAKK